MVSDKAEGKDKNDKADAGNTSPGRTYSERSGSGGDKGKKSLNGFALYGGERGDLEDENPEKWSFILRRGIRWC